MIYEANFDGCQVNSARIDAKRLLVEIHNDDEVKAGPRTFNPIHLICLAIVEYGIILAIITIKRESYRLPLSILTDYSSG